MNEGSPSPDMRAELVPEPRHLEAVVVFWRHGSAEDAQVSNAPLSLDMRRILVPKGIAEVQTAAEKLNKEIGVGKGGDLVLCHTSNADRATQTVVRGLGELLKEDGRTAPSVEIEDDGQISEPTAATDNRELLPYGVDDHAPDEESWFMDIYQAAVERSGQTQGMGEQWARHPELLQADIDAAGIENLTAEEYLQASKSNFQRRIAACEGAAAKLYKKWESEDGRKSEDTPPRLIMLEGSHAAIVSEAWLLEVVKSYEEQTGEQIRLDLDKGNYFTVTIPGDQKLQATLKIGEVTIPVPPQMLKMPESKVQNG